MDSIMNSAVEMAQRLAATIPTPSKDQSAHDAIKQIAGEITTAQCIKDLLILTIIVVSALELLSNLVYHVPNKARASSIPVRGKHLDNFSWKDWTCIAINKVMTGFFVYCYFGYLWSVRKTGHEHHVHHEHGEHHHHHEHEHEEQSMGGHHDCCGGGEGVWSMGELSLVNTLLPIPLLFFTYDFFYTLLHWFLHVKSVYAYVHKHHHHQKAPSRANIDAVNVHPLEFFLGEFNHILALHLVVKGMPLVGFHGMDVSWLGATLFIGLGGVLAGLNHTRHDMVVRIPSGSCGGGWTMFDSKHHDVHHRIPQSNYGQYTVAWDRIFGTFRDYDENDRVNPAYQLDPSTRKTIKSLKKE
ncbi:hypothetical protein ACHAXR_004357 [Thalassiosira sp. AJA248-18]